MFSLVLLLSSISFISAQVADGLNPFSTSALACPAGSGPMNVTSDNWSDASALFDDYLASFDQDPMAPLPYAWIGSWNTDSYNGACIAFYGNSINVPDSCDTPAPTLCYPEDASTPPPAIIDNTSLPPNSTTPTSSTTDSTPVASSDQSSTDAPAVVDLTPIIPAVDNSNSTTAPPTASTVAKQCRRRSAKVKRNLIHLEE